MVHFKFCVMSISVLLWVLTFSVGRAIHCSVQTLIGVSQSKLPLYLPKKDFVCFDGSLTIPYDWINDDYCDCPDGSDEPSTSACPNSVFHCINMGYKPWEIPSSRVNDGICDCCDGSDEYCKIVNCTNTCLVLKAKATADLESRLELLAKGNAIRNEMILKGKEIKLEKAIRIAELDEDLKQAEEIMRNAETLKKSWEDKEKELIGIEMSQESKREEELTEERSSHQHPKDVFNQMDENKDALLQANEVLIMLKSLEICESKIKSTIEDEVMYIMNMNAELSFDDFVELSWNRFKVLMALSNNETRSDKKKHKNVGDNIKKNVRDPTKYDEESRRIFNETINAREIYEKAEKAAKEIENHRTYLHDFLEIDFGPDEEFMALEGESFCYVATSYNYTFCPFQQVLQTGLNGGCEVRLGLWSKWETPSNYSTMIYSQGDECWNGPRRSAKVHISCGLENELIGAEEPDKCFYELHFKTPAACNLEKIREATDLVHDEL